MVWKGITYYMDILLEGEGVADTKRQMGLKLEADYELYKKKGD